MIEKLEEYKEKIENWATERNIYNGSDHYKQLLKLGEEFSELLVAINKGDEKEIKDAVGDMFVCVVNVGKFLDVDIFEFISKQLKGDLRKIDVGITDLSNSVFNCLLKFSEKNTEPIPVLIAVLGDYCRTQNIDFLECVYLAWNTIKDRKGKLINGKFVKEE